MYMFKHETVVVKSVSESYEIRLSSRESRVKRTQLLAFGGLGMTLPAGLAWLRRGADKLLRVGVAILWFWIRGFCASRIRWVWTADGVRGFQGVYAGQGRGRILDDET